MNWAVKCFALPCPGASTLERVSTDPPAEQGEEHREHRGATTSYRPGEALARIERTLADVTAALGRLDDGSYACCEICGSTLPDTLLARDPLVRRCDGCAAAGVTGEPKP